jgi:hypothetical protein
MFSYAAKIIDILFYKHSKEACSRDEVQVLYPLQFQHI